jgi:hypothetical protein
MYLPPRALALISEYSKPITRVDWKTQPKMKYKDFRKYLDNNKFNKVIYLLTCTHELTRPIYTIEDIPFTIKIGQEFLHNDKKYTVIQIGDSLYKYNIYIQEENNNNSIKCNILRYTNYLQYNILQESLYVPIMCNTTYCNYDIDYEIDFFVLDVKKCIKYF